MYNITQTQIRNISLTPEHFLVLLLIGTPSAQPPRQLPILFHLQRLVLPAEALYVSETLQEVLQYGLFHSASCL